MVCICVAVGNEADVVYLTVFYETSYGLFWGVHFFIGHIAEEQPYRSFLELQAYCSVIFVTKIMEQENTKVFPLQVYKFYFYLVLQALKA